MNLTVEMLLPLAGILVGARLAGLAAQRLGFPAVFGELMLGLIIGPSVLNWVHSGEALHLLADIGVIVLMFMAGLETDLAEMRRVGKTSLLAATGGVILPLAGGIGVGIASGMDLNTALFLGAVLTATSVSISAQTLRELGQLRSVVGTTILSAAIIDDVLGVLIFALVMSLAGEGSLLLTLGKMILFFPIAWFAGERLLPPVIRWTARINHRESVLAILLGILLVYAWAAEVFGSVATITGAYLLGVLVSRHVDHQHIVHSGMASLGYGFFIPIFFVNIGLQAQASGLVSSPLLTGALIVLAILTKVIGSGAGALVGGMSKRSALQVGTSMVSRGEVALVMAGAGLTAGLLDATTFSVLILVTLATTLITPPMLRLSFTPAGMPDPAAPSAAPIPVPVTSRPSFTAQPLERIKRALAIPDWQEFMAEEQEA